MHPSSKKRKVLLPSFYKFLNKLTKVTVIRRRKSIYRKFIKRGRVGRILIMWTIKSLTKVDFRLVWYSLLLWFLSVAIGGFVVLPWFYPIITICVFWVTVAFFGRGFGKIYKRRQDKIFMRGLLASLFWAVAVLCLDIIVFVGFNFQSLVVYFSDPRSWFLYPLIILAPIIYSLVLENLEKRELSMDSLLESDLDIW